MGKLSFIFMNYGLSILIILFIVIVFADYIMWQIYAAFIPKVKVKAKQNGDKYNFYSGTATGNLKTLIRVSVVFIFGYLILVCLWIVGLLLFKDQQQLFINQTVIILLISGFLASYFLFLPLYDICRGILLRRESKKYLTQTEIDNTIDEGKERIRKRVKIFGFIMLGAFVLMLGMCGLLNKSVQQGGNNIGKGSQNRDKLINKETGEEFEDNPVNN